MKSKLFAVALITSFAFALTGPAGAFGATEFGDNCTVDAGGPGDVTLMTLSAPPSSLPLTAPVGGVVTKVKLTNGIPLPLSVPISVKVLHPAGESKFTTVGQETIQTSGGATSTDARIPIQAGDRLGMHGLPFTYMGTPYPGFLLYCTAPGATLGVAIGDVPPGATAEFAPTGEARVPLAAVIEPDADNDGFGDETQDKCPQSAAVTQVTCPVVILDSLALPKKGSVVVVVSTSTPSPVSVSGKVKLPKAPKGKASVSATARLKTVTKEVTPGNLARFTLKFPAKMKKALAALPSRKSLKLSLTASATNAAGQVSKDVSKLKLKGGSR